MTQSFQQVLFLCSGNFYRSRFAEALFNHRASLAGLSWEAFSKGFKPHIEDHDLSPFASEALAERRIPLELTRAKPDQVEAGDFTKATLIVAMLESEHRPKMQTQFPDWEHRVTYWDIHDIDVEPPKVALPLLEGRVIRLLENLKGTPEDDEASQI